ncbi:MAG: hypothetical protein Ta2E_08800 [Mycoplasmoidaceae bacterium]|nr:MAG: hypothetical protein Ta2E_08800 [Mycoplasmoidaceae bacterium]
MAADINLTEMDLVMDEDIITEVQLVVPRVLIIETYLEDKIERKNERNKRLKMEELQNKNDTHVTRHKMYQQTKNLMANFKFTYESINIKDDINLVKFSRYKNRWLLNM